MLLSLLAWFFGILRLLNSIQSASASSAFAYTQRLRLLHNEAIVPPTFLVPKCLRHVAMLSELMVSEFEALKPTKKNIPTFMFAAPFDRFAPWIVNNYSEGLYKCAWFRPVELRSTYRLNDSIEFMLLAHTRFLRHGAKSIESMTWWCWWLMMMMTMMKMRMMRMRMVPTVTVRDSVASGLRTRYTASVARCHVTYMCVYVCTHKHTYTHIYTYMYMDIDT